MRYGSDLPEPYVPQVKVPDMGAINSNALAGAVNMGRIQDMGDEYASRGALRNVLAQNPDATGPDVRRAMASHGFGDKGQTYEYNWLNKEKSALQYESDLRKEVANVVGTVTDEDTKNNALDYLQSRFPGSDFAQYRQLPWQKAREAGNAYMLGGAGRIKQEREDKTNSALGLPQGVDAGTYIQGQNTQQGMQQKAALFPGQVQGQALDNQGKAQVIQQRTEEGPLRLAERDARLKKLQEEASLLQSKAAQTHSNIQLKADEYNSPEGSFVFGFNRQTGVPERWDPQSQSWQPFGVKADGASTDGQQGAKMLDYNTARAYFLKAGRDPEKARAMARADGYTWTP